MRAYLKTLRCWWYTRQYRRATELLQEACADREAIYYALSGRRAADMADCVALDILDTEIDHHQTVVNRYLAKLESLK